MKIPTDPESAISADAQIMVAELYSLLHIRKPRAEQAPNSSFLGDTTPILL